MPLLINLVSSRWVGQMTDGPSVFRYTARMRWLSGWFHRVARLFNSRRASGVETDETRVGSEAEAWIDSPGLRPPERQR
jgi:hypothetical protein